MYLLFCEEEVHDLLIHVFYEIGISPLTILAWQTSVRDHKLGSAMVADDACARIEIVLATLVPVERKGHTFDCEITKLVF